MRRSAVVVHNSDVMMNRIGAFVRVARPRHWAKNAFVLMPVPFAVAAGAQPDTLPFFLGVAGFSLASSAVYVFNDVQDAENDKQHPEKRLRPVASGEIGRSAALVYSVVLLLAGIALARVSGSSTAVLVVLGYVSLNLIYSLGAKNLALIDVFLLSSGFILRVLLGCALVGVSPSSWLLLCSSTLALFMALTKRKAELLGPGAGHRPSLAGYTEVFLDQGVGITAGMTLVAYALYSMEAEVLLPGREFASLVFVVFGVLEYLRLSHVNGKSGSPVDLVMSSPSLILTSVGWAIATGWSLGLL